MFRRPPGLSAARWRYGPVSCGAMALFVAFACWELVGWGSVHVRMVISDLAPLPIELAATIMAVLAARRADMPLTRRAWSLIAAAYGCFGFGDALWAWFEVVQGAEPFPSMADAGYLAFYPLLFAGLLTLPGRRRSRAENVQLSLDVAIVVLASSTVVWYFVLSGLVRGAELDAATVLSIAYPVGDLVLIFAIATVLMRGVRQASAESVRVLMVGLAAFVVADVGFGHLSLSDSYSSPDWPDTFWVLALACMVASAERHCRTGSDRRSVEPEGDRVARRIPVLPYAAIAASYGLLMVASRDRVDYPVGGLLFGAAAVTAAVVMRQLTAMRENVALTDEFRRLATTDGLTGLVNRRHFMEVSERELARSRRTDRPLALFMIDVDHFKTINDTHGHAVGDEVLRWLADRCRSNLRPTDVISRFGGDEFVILLPNTPIEVAGHVGRRLVADVASHDDPVAGGPTTITLSLGVASTEGCADVDAVLVCADAALYQAKRGGRGRAAVHSTMDT